jgi:predicted acetyltransferase
MLVEFSKKNMHIFYTLAQAYEAEFSFITKKLPNENGIFELDTMPSSTIKGYFWFLDNLPAGFILIDLVDQPYDVNEIYVIPSFRNKKIGEEIFIQVLKNHPGNWQVKQLLTADKARTFWRKVIGKYTQGNYKDEEYNDKYWGQVTRQVFKTH